MRYSVKLSDELKLDKLSIANSEMMSVLNLLVVNRSNEEEFHKLIHYAKELQWATKEIELALKKELRKREITDKF